MKAYIKFNQGPSQLPAKREQTRKAKMSDVYYDKSYIDYFYFCQQCKDYLKIVGVS